MRFSRIRRDDQGGYALLLVLVVSGVLGVLALASVNKAARDATSAGTHVRSVEAAHNAVSGLEHARQLFVDGDYDLAEEALSVASLPTRCAPGWIGTSGNQVERPQSIDGVEMNYSVDLCYAACSSAGPGNDLAAGSTGGNYVVGVSLDVVAGGGGPRGSQHVNAGGILHVSTTTSAPCN